MEQTPAAHLRELEEMCRRRGISTKVDTDSRDFWLFVCASGCLATMAVRGERDFLIEMLRNGPFRPARKFLERKVSPWKVCQRMLGDFPDGQVRDFFRAFVVASSPGLNAALGGHAATYEEFSAYLKKKAPYADFHLYSLAKAFLENTDGLPELGAEDLDLVEGIRIQYRIVNLEYRLRKSGISPDRERAAKLLAPYRAEIVRLQQKLARAEGKVEEANVLAEISEGEKERLVAENEKLRRELAAVHEDYSRRITALEAELARLRRRNAALLASKRSSPLAGARVCVVGDPNRAAVYRDILEQRGAEMDFIHGFDDKGRASEAAGAADGVILVTAYCCHAVHEAVKSEAARRGVPVVLVNTAGMTSFLGGVEELERRLSEGSQAGAR